MLKNRRVKQKIKMEKLALKIASNIDKNIRNHRNNTYDIKFEREILFRMPENHREIQLKIALKISKIFNIADDGYSGLKYCNRNYFRNIKNSPQIKIAKNHNKIL